jgi:hypothetical protein
MKTNWDVCLKKSQVIGGANWLKAFCSCTTMGQLTHPKLGWLLQLTAVLKILSHPPYSLDFYLFLKLKTKHRCRPFGRNEAINYQGQIIDFWLNYHNFFFLRPHLGYPVYSPRNRYEGVGVILHHTLHC